ncbi:hypothetical protein [Sulfitobacter sabulilitoris]|uniref:Curlin n=1 Tax=Sulfitobacter sabulilitoris TaxID=2562655 RepID=A0A5S3PDB2_9RHOB|nr:hypothetical protein [Sulfitobacter sabulilitoris]TMM51861.1 hypothetical protein FDT80_14070 [Sulfitobacter sabulilitoris]
MLQRSGLTFLASAAVLLMAGASFADGNKLFITQDSSLAGAVGNTLFVDQSRADGSIVSGALGSTSTSATQTGPGNAADIRISGSQGQVALNQTSSVYLPQNGNSANVDLGGLLATGVITQTGISNSGGITVDGLRASGLLEQTGNGNVGSVEVSGTDAFGRLVQTGNNNNTGLVVTGANTNVTLTQTGSNITAAPTVASNGGTVIINQFSN